MAAVGYSVPMAQVHIARRGVNVGCYPEADLSVLVGVGTILRTDHYWKKGMRIWLVVGHNFDPPAQKPVIAASASGPTVPQRSSGPRYCCERCGHRANSVKEEKPGNFFMEICAWVLNPFCGGFYTISRELGKVYRCKSCDSQHVVEEVW